MESLIQVIARENSPVPQEWITSPNYAFGKLNAHEKCRFILDQSVLLNYLERVYNYDLPKILKLYKDKVVQFWVPEIKYLAEHNPDTKVFQQAYLNISSLLRDNSAPVDEGECEEILQENSASDVSFYSPYLMFLEKERSLERVIEGQESFTSPKHASLPAFSVVGSVLRVSYHDLFPKYQFDYKDMCEYVSGPNSMGPRSIFTYWRGYDWSGKKFLSVVGVLAMQALELDPHLASKDSLLGLYQDMYRLILPWSSPSMKLDVRRLSSESIFFRQCALTFLLDLRRRFSIELDTTKILSELMLGTQGNEADHLRQFLSAELKSDVSVEDYETYRKSIFGNYRELDLSIHNRKKMSEVIEASIQEKALANSPLSDIQTQAAFYSKITLTSTHPKTGPLKDVSELADDSFLDADANTSESEDTNPFSSISDNIEETPDFTDENNKPDDEPNKPNAFNVDDPKVNDNTHNESLELPKIGNVAGVTFPLSDGEITDSVFRRIELEAYISSIISNPPEKLTSQVIECLKFIKAFIINLMPLTDLVKNIQGLLKAK